MTANFVDFVRKYVRKDVQDIQISLILRVEIIDHLQVLYKC